MWRQFYPPERLGFDIKPNNAIVSGFPQNVTFPVDHRMPTCYDHRPVDLGNGLPVLSPGTIDYDVIALIVGENFEI